MAVKKRKRKVVRRRRTSSRVSTPVRRRRKRVSGFKSPINLYAVGVGAGSTYLHKVFEMIPVNIPFFKPLLLGALAMLTDTPKMKEVNIAISTLFGASVMEEIKAKIESSSVPNDPSVGYTPSLDFQYPQQISGLNAEDRTDEQII